METISYHKATLNEIKMMSGMRLAFLTEYFGKRDEKEEIILLENLRSYFKNALENNSAFCWYAKSGDSIAGIGFIEIHDQPGNFKNPSGKVGHVMNMYTLKAFRKNGIASTILNNLVNSASEIGVSSFELNTSKEGLPVYEKNGFRLHPDPSMRRSLS